MRCCASRAPIFFKSSRAWQRKASLGHRRRAPFDSMGTTGRRLPIGSDWIGSALPLFFERTPEGVCIGRWDRSGVMDTRPAALLTMRNAARDAMRCDAQTSSRSGGSCFALSSLSHGLRYGDLSPERWKRAYMHPATGCRAQMLTHMEMRAHTHTEVCAATDMHAAPLERSKQK